MKKILLITYLLLTIMAQGQNNRTLIPDLVPPSPQAAQFMRYGEIPVGHTTGVPQIDIPIYTLKTGWIDIPISICYHASGFRSKEIASPVGLGWVLNAGGLISRSIEMNPDYETLNPTNNYGTEMPVKSATDVNNLKNGTKTLGNVDFSNYANWNDWEIFFFNSYPPQLDTRSDRYFYSFPGGENGVARYNVDTKELTTIPYTPIKIERISQDFYRVTDTKGIKYEYAQKEYCSPPEKGVQICGWYLTKITYPGRESEPVVFTYQNESYYDYFSFYNQVTQIIDTRSVPLLGSSQSGFPQADSYTQANGLTISYTSPLIQTITWKNVTITFSYSTDRMDSYDRRRQNRITSLTVKYGSDIVKQAVFDNDAYFGNTNKNKRLKLKGITIKGSNTTNEGDKYAFNYYNEAASIPDYEYKCHDDYWGYYNGTNSDWSFPGDINIDNATGNNFVGAWFNHSVYSTNRQPFLESTKTCVLKEIIYPTKGKSVFEYELNQVPNAYEFISNYNYVGGLRLKQRTNYLNDNAVADIKTYDYTGYPTQPLKYGLFVYRMKCIDEYYYSICDGVSSGGFCSSFQPIEYPIYFFTGTPLTSLTGWTGSNVFYYKVKEYNGTTTNSNYDGWTEYYYEEENRTLNNDCSWNSDEYPSYMFSKYADCDKGNIKGLIDSVITYNKSGNIVKKEQRQYKNFSIPSIHTGVRVFQNAIYKTSGILEPPAIPMSKSFGMRLDYWSTVGQKKSEYQTYYLDMIYAFDTYAFRDVSLLSSATETNYVGGQAATAKTTSFTYDVKDSKPVLFTPSSETIQNSNGESWVTKTFFPYSDSYKNSAPYNTMVTNNMLYYPVEVKTEKGANNQFVNQMVTSYKQVSGMIVPGTISTKYASSAVLEPRIVYNDYNTYGNPLYIVKDGVDQVVYIWSYKGQYPIAEITGATYADVKTALGYTSDTQVESLAAQATPDVSSIDSKLRSYFKDKTALVTTYTYKPLVGILTMTDPRGVVTKYDYDSFGRLSKVTRDNKVIETYDYHYVNQ